MLLKQYCEITPTVSDTLAQAPGKEDLIKIDTLVIEHRMPILSPLIRDELIRRKIISGSLSGRDPSIENILTDENFSLDALKDLYNYGIRHNMSFLTVAAANELVNRHERDYVENNLYLATGKSPRPDYQDINELVLINLFPEGVTTEKDIDFVVRQLVANSMFYIRRKNRKV